MVFFVCEACNETLKKNQVEKHTFKCRQCQSVTCVDCSVSFYGNDYEKHISCVSEAEKYEKSLYKAKKVKANPQDAWIEIIEKAVITAPTNLKTHMNKLKDFSNIPRNKNKFINFCKNSLRLNSDTILVSLWDFIDSCRSSQVVDKKEIDEEKPILVTNNEDNKKKRKITEEDIITDPEVIDLNKKEKKKKSKKEKEEITKEVIIDESEKKEKKKSKKEKKEIIIEEITSPIIEDIEIKKKKKKDKKEKKEKKGNYNN